MNKLLKYTAITFVVLMAWVLGGIVAIPVEIVHLDSDLSVQPLQQNKIIVSEDIQHAGDAGLLWTTTDPQPR